MRLLKDVVRQIVGGQNLKTSLEGQKGWLERLEWFRQCAFQQGQDRPAETCSDMLAGAFICLHCKNVPWLLEVSCGVVKSPRQVKVIPVSPRAKEKIKNIEFGLLDCFGRIKAEVTSVPSETRAFRLAVGRRQWRGERWQSSYLARFSARRIGSTTLKDLAVVLEKIRRNLLPCNEESHIKVHWKCL